MNRSQIRHRVLVSAVAVTLLAGAAACAARTPRDRAQVGALTVTEALKAIDALEVDLAASVGPEVYPPTARVAVNDGIYKVAVAVTAYTKAVKQWPQDGLELPVVVAQSRKGLLDAIAELKRVIPDAEAIRQPLTRALNALEAALTTPDASLSSEMVVRAQMVPPIPVGPFAWLNMAFLLLQLFQKGKLAFEDIVAVAKKAGATQEELDAAIGVSSEIADRRKPGDPSVGTPLVDGD